MGEGLAEVDSVELKITDMQRDLAVGMSDIKGSLAVIMTKSEQTERTLAEQARRFEQDQARQDAALVAALLVRDKADEDREGRLRSVERKAALYAGVGMTIATVAGTLLGNFLPR